MKTAILIFLSLFSIPNLQAQEKQKDTLFFNYNYKYIRTHIEMPNEFYIKDGSSANFGTFFFKEVRVLNNLNVKKILCLKKYVRSSKYYDKNKETKLDYYKLAFFLNNYILFLKKKANQNIFKSLQLLASNKTLRNQ
ncbi:hypothetical protein [Flavobacterium sp. WC2430]|uniref:hypothetical protein n=1 Tax=Flavobacterium sp. WC2430 TaxID=3234137 RepID=UPI003465EED6